jgi:hypothetical protein
MPALRTVPLLLLALLAAACMTPRGGRGDDDDDDSASGDDDTGDDDTGDDDTGDDDTGDDDTGDDDTGDDDTGDDDTGDDDDATPASYPWVEDVYCLDWNSVTWVSPPAFVVQSLMQFGLSLVDAPFLLSPLAVNGGQFTARAGSGTATCTQDMTSPAADPTGSWVQPQFSIAASAMETTVAGLAVPVYNVEISGTIAGAGSTITNSELFGVVDASSLSSICAFIGCTACPVGVGGSQCFELSVTAATWNSVGAGPLVIVL